MSSTPEFNETQLAAARATAWHQNGEPLLTIDAARAWLQLHGLLLFAPRPQLLAPAPSLVEATLGAANSAPTLAELETARSLAARLVSEGAAIPLNLLGVPGDLPDFIVTPQVFSFIFTMRGDKLWKQPPSTSGAIKVAPLGLHVYEVLAERGSMSAAELANELGREVTEAAILRALVELWSQLRVLPLLDQGGGATLWELTTRRFTKSIKAGANAGQPTALSALISLYLGQSFAVTEEEIAAFLSPLTARSRVREVVNALVGARQLETAVLAGKSLVYIPGALPEFVVPVAEVVAEDAEPATVALGEAAPRERIRSFKSDRGGEKSFRAKPAGGYGAKSAGGYGARPARSGSDRPARSYGDKPAYGDKPSGGFAKRSYGAKPAFDKPRRSPGADSGGERTFGRSDRERRPFQRSEAPTPAERNEFARPWDEERVARPSFDAAAEGGAVEGGLPVERSSYPPRKPSFGGKPAYGARPSFGAKKSFGDKGGFGKKPGFGGGRSFGSKPAFGERSGGFAKREGGFAKREGGFAPRDGERPYRKREEGEGGRGGWSKPAFDRPQRAPRSRDFEAGPSEGAGGDARPRKSFGVGKFGGTPSFGGKPSFGGDSGGFAKKPGGFSKPGGFRPKSGGFAGKSNGFAGKPGGFKPAGKFGPKPGGFAGKSSGFAGKSSGFAGKPGGFRPKPGGFAGKSGGFAGKAGGFAGKPRTGFGSGAAPRRRRDEE